MRLPPRLVSPLHLQFALQLALLPHDELAPFLLVFRLLPLVVSLLRRRDDAVIHLRLVSLRMQLLLCVL